jgi:hypothetical protein
MSALDAATSGWQGAQGGRRGRQRKGAGLAVVVRQE